MRRRSSSRVRSSSNNTNGSDAPPVPAVPATSVAQARGPQIAVASVSDGRANSISNKRKPSHERNMLRKVSSRYRKEEMERLEQERQARLNEPAPRLPSHNPLPGIGTFGDDHTTSAPSLPSNNSNPNFSRPGNPLITSNMPSSTLNNSSSSPAYAVRSAKSSSSTPDSGGRTNGEYVPDHMSRTESMTNRGRYSYASSMAPVNSNSPRRIRRRKDPTPFK